MCLVRQALTVILCSPPAVAWFFLRFLQSLVMLVDSVVNQTGRYCVDGVMQHVDADSLRLFVGNRWRHVQTGKHNLRCSPDSHKMGQGSGLAFQTGQGNNSPGNTPGSTVCPVNLLRNLLLFLLTSCFNIQHFRRGINRSRAGWAPG